VAGKIIADIIEAPYDSIKMNVGNVTVLTANSSGLNYIPTGNVNINIGGTSANLTMNLLTANGIKFPATQVSSADANTLDDYEEGTWTPTLGGTSSDPTGVTHDGRVGYYTKVGRQVTIQGWLGFTTYTGGSGTFLIRGLPFAAANIGSFYFMPGVALTEKVNYTAGYTYAVVRTINNDSYLDVLEAGDDVAWRGVNLTQVPSGATGKYVAFTLTYFTS
jgi:hypothetical protein